MDKGQRATCRSDLLIPHFSSRIPTWSSIPDWISHRPCHHPRHHPPAPSHGTRQTSSVSLCRSLLILSSTLKQEMQGTFRCRLQQPLLYLASPTSAAVRTEVTTLPGYRQRNLLGKSPFRSYTSHGSIRQSGTEQTLIHSDLLFRTKRCAAEPLSLRSVWSRCFSVGAGTRSTKGSVGTKRSQGGPLTGSSPRCIADASNAATGKNSWRRSFNSRTAGSVECRLHPSSQPRTLQARYHTSPTNSVNHSSGPPNNSNVGVFKSATGVDALQTWRRPLLSSVAGSETRALATMPTLPTLKGAPGKTPDPAARLQRSMQAVPHHNIKNEIKLRCTEFDHRGNVKTTAGEFLKSDLCQQVC